MDDFHHIADCGCRSPDQSGGKECKESAGLAEYGGGRLSGSVGYGRFVGRGADESVDRDNRTYHSVGSQQCNGVQEEYSFGSQCEWKHRIFGCFYADIQDKVCQSSFSERDFLSNVEEIYWEKVQDKATKKEHYNYSVKYPFSRLEQRKLTAEFEALDAGQVARYEALEQKIGAIESADEISRAIMELNTLSEYFFDDVRLSQVKGLTARYRQLYDALTLTGTFLESGKYQCQLLLDGNPIKVAAKPKVTSNCAGQISVRPADGMFVITYSAEDCLPEEENFLNISLTVGGKRLQHKAFLNEAGTGSMAFSVVPEGKLVLTADSVADRKIFNINIRLTLNNRGGTPFGLKALELHVPEISAPIIFDDIDGVYKTKGIIQIKALAEGEFTVGEKKKSLFSFVQGAITFVNPQTGAVERSQLSLPYVTNWE